MTYLKQTWNNDDPTTPVSAARLGYIEEGIETTSEGVDALRSDVDAKAPESTALHKDVGAAEVIQREHRYKVGQQRIDVAAWATFAEAVTQAASVRGILECHPTGNGEINITAPVVLPKTPLTIRGHGRGGTRLKGTGGVAAGTPLFSWDTTVAGHVQYQTIESMQVDRINDGPMFQFRQSAAGGAGGAGDRFFSAFKNLQTNILAGTTGIHYDIEWGLQPAFEHLQVDGGGLALSLLNSSHAYVKRLYTPQKVTGPNFCKVEGGGAHTFYSCRSEGSLQLGYTLWCLNTVDNTFYDLRTEGDQEAEVFRIEGSKNILFFNPSIGNNDATTAAAPRGVKFINSKACRITGGYASQLNTLFPGVGRAIEIDSNCRDIIIDGLVVEGNALATEIINSGVESYVVAYAESSSPTHIAYMTGQIGAAGVLSRGVGPKFGSITNHTVELVQNNSIRARLTSVFDMDVRINQNSGMAIPEGTNAFAGLATLSSGTVTVATNRVTATSRIQLTRQTGGGTRGQLEIGTRTAGVSFVINSVDTTGTVLADTSTVYWRIIEVA